MKRIFAFGCVMAVMFGILILRVAYIANGKNYVEAAVNQSRKVFVLAKTRAGIFDRNMEPFVHLSPSEIDQELWKGQGTTDQLHKAIQRLRTELKKVSSEV